MAIPLKNCDQCSHYRGGYCYGFGIARKVISKSEAILCGKFTPLGQVQIGPLDSLGGQLKEYQIPSGIISTVKLADAAVTLAKLSASSVNDSKVVPSAGIIESKLNLDFGTSALNTDIQTREESSNKGAVSGYCGLDVSQLVPLANLSNLTNAQLAVAAAIAESKLNLVYGTQALHDDIQARALLATYLAHDHSLADPTQVDFNNLLNINPLVLPGGLTVGGDIGFGGHTITGKTFYCNVKDYGFQTANWKIYQRSADNRLVFGPTAGQTGLFDADLEIDGDLTTVNVVSAGLVDGVDVSEEPARITTEIDTDISTHAGIATAHQDAPALIATHAGIATAHQDAPALIATHAGIATAHQDAPALITTHATNANAHHAQSHNLASHSDVTITGPEVEDLTAFGSANAQWINCPLEMWRPTDAFQIDAYGRVTNTGSVDGHIHYSVPLPTTRGGKKLYISGTRVSLSAANGTNYVTDTNITAYSSTGYTYIDTDPTNKNAVQLWEDLSMGALDLSAYHVAKVRLVGNVADAVQLGIQFVTVRYYYAD